MPDEMAAASGSNGLMWAGGIAAGLAAGAAVWFFAIGPMEPAAEPDAAVAEAVAEPEAAAAEPEAATAEPVAASAEPEAAASDAPAQADESAATEAVTEPEAAAPPPAPAEPQAEASAAAPRFDTVRSEPDGSVLVAGQAGPGTSVAVMSDGAEVGRATADAAGNFVAFLDMGVSAAPRVLTLMSDAGQPSSETVILAPSPEPVVVAEATPEADQAAAEDAEPATEAEPVADATAAGADAPVEDVAAAADIAPAEPAPTAQPLVISDAGVKKLAPAPAEGVVIDTISYGALGQVQIEGRGQGGSYARLYLDNVAVVTAPIGAKGNWGAVLTDVAAGIYTLRVDQVDGSGTVTSRFETPFQREAPEAVAAAAEVPAAPVAEPVAEAAAETTPAEVADAVSADQAATATEPTPAPEPVAVKRARVVTVQPGFTLWQIATENYGDGMLYVKVFEANKGQIRDPDLIYPGQIFAVPAASE